MNKKALVKIITGLIVVFLAGCSEDGDVSAACSSAADEVCATITAGDE